MTIGAINAFLKTCEEPLPNRIIIATSVNKSQILDTVISRSISLNFSSDDINSEHDFTTDLDAVVKVLSTDTNIHNKHKLLSEINKK
jgi:DNA polymerase III gamma/tau subunit